MIKPVTLVYIMLIVGMCVDENRVLFYEHTLLVNTLWRWRTPFHALYYHVKNTTDTTHNTIGISSSSNCKFHPPVTLCVIVLLLYLSSGLGCFTDIYNTVNTEMTHLTLPTRVVLVCVYCYTYVLYMQTLRFIYTKIRKFKIKI